MPRSGRTRPLVAPVDGRRVALMPGCVQQVLAPAIDEAATRVLARRGVALVPLRGAGCCGALVHHLGRRGEAQSWAKRAIRAFENTEETGANFEAIASTASGCSAHLRDYPHLFDGDRHWHGRAVAFAAKVADFSELASPRPVENARPFCCAWHPPCSLTHGLKRSSGPEDALRAAGFDVRIIPESHICCGSAGSYSVLEPTIAQALRARKLEQARSVTLDAIVSCNIGCIVHLSGPDAPPVLHLAEALDWAEGGPVSITSSGTPWQVRT